jgi:predicted glycosyltransferase
MPLNNTHKTILVAVLDWGLGHAARMTPVIKHLEAMGQRVILGVSGNALKFLKHEFRDKEFIELPAYNPVYHERLSMGMSMALQTPKFLKAIYDEHRLLEQIVKEYRIDGIISDNRYGMFHETVPCVLITHQLFIQTSASQTLLKPILNKINFSFINRFNFCWIPDVGEAGNNFSGNLSHGNIPKHCRFIGLLSRFEKKELPELYDALILLSGPEPQRTVLEQKIIAQLFINKIRALLVRGVIDDSVIELPKNIIVKNFLSGNELEDAINSSKVVLARSGYSTAMDLIKTGSEGIFIPTPGQTEQEYLAEYWKSKKWFYAETQEDFNIERCLEESANYAFTDFTSQKKNLMEQAVNEFLGYL